MWLKESQPGPAVGWGGVASRAVDGKGSGTWGHGTCTHSANAEHNVWKVDLIDDWKVDRIQISNRMDCCQNRLNGAKVFVGDELCGTIEYVAGKNWYVLDCEGKVGSTVSVSQTGQYLTLCEVMVLASPHDEDIGLINIISSGVASQSSTGWNGDASRGVDGKVDGDYFEGLTCTHTGAPNGWWNLKLADPQAISKVVIYNRADCCQDRINGVTVYADDFLCGTIRYVAGQKVYKVGCNSDEVKNVIASNIKIQSAAGQYLTLCEVKVLADPRVAVGEDSLVNLALGKPTSQSSVGWGGVSSRAVDGNANGQWNGASCTHTTAAGWWNVDLKELYLVKSLTIKNRVDCCSNRINGVQVFVDDVLCGTIAFNPVKYVYHVECPDGGLVGENVKIVNPATYLTLCEVEVWGKGDPIVEDGTEVIVGSKSAAVDDSFSDADCTEASMTITHCEVETGNVGVNSDGCLANANRCRAHNGWGGQGVIARAICSENPRRANPCGGDTNPLYNYQHAKGAAPKLECAAGYAPLECQAHSYWVEFLRNKNVGLDGIISNDHPCEVLACNDNNWCEVSLICKLIQNTEEYREAVCPNCDNFVCGDAEVCEMDGDEPECVGQQIGCDDNEMCGDHGSCVPEGYDGYLCECDDGYEFDERAGTCLPKSSIYRKVYGDKAIGDDARSSAACNVGEVVMRCHTFGAPSAADGVTVHVNDEVATCEARASNSRKFPVMAVAYCGNAPEVKDPCTSDMIGTIEYRYGTGAAPSVSCPDGYIMDSCVMWSPWSQLYTASTKARINSLGAVAVSEDGACNVEDCLSNKEERLFCKLTAICRKLTGSEYVKAACPTCDQVECPSGQECQMASDLPVCLPRVPGGCEVDKCGEGECIEEGADYTCKCPAGHSFNEVTCVDVNECQELPCGNGECTNSPGSYSCACNDGYEAAKGTCVDVNECNDDPCVDSERCSNTEGSYVCDCLDSFIKDPKSKDCVCADGYEASEGACVDVDECDADPCGDNQDCTNSVGNYLCECSEGFEMVESGACEEIQVMEDCALKAAKSKIKAFKNTNVKIKLKGESKKTLKKNTKISWVRNGDKWNPKSDGKSKFNGFTLKKFGPEDAGEYVGTVLIDEDGVKSQCTILINIELLEGKVELVIANEKKLAKPQNSGEELVIKCDADIVNVKLKDPKSADNVSWYKVSPDEDVDDVRLEDDGDDISIIREKGSYQLVFANPSPEDSGTYRCEFDQQGVDASTDVTIEVV